MTIRHDPVVLAAVAILGAAFSVTCVYADLPHAVAVVDDASDRILLFDANDGSYLSELPLGETTNLKAPLDCEIGPEITIGEVTHPDTILVSDLRTKVIMAFDRNDGSFLKTIVSSVSVHGLAYDHNERLLIAAGSAGVLAYTPAGTFVDTCVAPEPVDGPKNAWDVLVRPQVDGGAGDMLVADPTLDVIVRFDLNGHRLGVFAKLPEFEFIEQLALRANGHVLAADVFANSVYEFESDGTWLRTISVTRPRGVIELSDGNLLIAGEDGVQLFDGQAGTLLSTLVAGYPTSAPRYIRYLHCRLPFIRGDMNGDGVVNLFDVDPFILALGDPTGYAQQYPTVDCGCAGDANRDGAFDLFDIDPFIELVQR